MDNRDMSYIQRYIDHELENTKNTIYNALLSMTHSKRLEHGMNGDYSCPSCGKIFHPVRVVEHHNYCSSCGQAFEWPETGNDE